MDVCRMTQAYRQQHPGLRHPNNKRATSSPSTGLAVSDDGTHTPVASHHHDQQSSHSSTLPSSSSSSSSGFSLASMLPESLASVLATNTSTRAPATSSPVASASSFLPGLNMGELEAQSLLLRSMPMFGSLISRD